MVISKEQILKTQELVEKHGTLIDNLGGRVNDEVQALLYDFAEKAVQISMGLPVDGYEVGENLSEKKMILQVLGAEYMDMIYALIKENDNGSSKKL